MTDEDLIPMIQNIAKAIEALTSRIERLEDMEEPKKISESDIRELTKGGVPDSWKDKAEPEILHAPNGYLNGRIRAKSGNGA